jgi:hypothetical protein
MPKSGVVLFSRDRTLSLETSYKSPKFRHGISEKWGDDGFQIATQDKVL